MREFQVDLFPLLLGREENNKEENLLHHHRMQQTVQVATLLFKLDAG